MRNGLTTREFEALSQELRAWIDEHGRSAPSEQWDCIMESVRMWRPQFHNGYIFGKTVLHEVLE